MVDFDPSALGGAADKAKEAMQSLLPVLKDVYNTLSSTFGTSAVNDVSKYTDAFTDGIKQASQSFSKMKTDLGDINKLTSFEVKFDGDKPKKAIDDLSLKFSELGAFVSNAKMFDTFAQSSQTSINTITDSIAGLQAGLENLGVGHIDVEKYTRIFANADQAEKLEHQYMSLAATTGTLNQLFDGQGTVIKDLSGITADYTNMVGRVAQSTQLGVPVTLGFANALGTIPHAMESYITTAAGSIDKTTGLQAAMQLMSGSGQHQEDVIKALSTAYEKLSTDQGKITDSTQKGMEMFALMSQVANTLDLRFSDVSEALGSIADKFQFVGNETEGASHMLERYTGALRETGLTATASVRIVNDMAEAVGHLSMGTKAFISARSGGPGGLQGAFRIEEMLREGKIDKVTGMIEQTLKQQFGGKIYNLKEASQSSEAASGFMKQRSMLMSGAFGSLVGNDEGKATRLLEAFSKGRGGDATAVIKDGQHALTQTLARGQSVQERDSNFIKQGNVLAQRTAMASEISAGALVRLTFGNKGPAGQDMAKRSEELRREVGKDLDAQMAKLKGGVMPNDWKAGVSRTGREVGNDVLDLPGQFAGIGGKMAKMAAGAGSDIINDIAGAPAQPQTMAPGNMPHRASVMQQVMHHAPERTAMQNHTAAAVQAATAQHQAQKHTDSMTQKVELTITAPPGFDVKTKKQDASVIIKHINQQSRVPNPSDPGY